jgi:hypothetical protein
VTIPLRVLGVSAVKMLPIRNRGHAEEAQRGVSKKAQKHEYDKRKNLNKTSFLI